MKQIALFAVVILAASAAFAQPPVETQVTSDATNVPQVSETEAKLAEQLFQDGRQLLFQTKYLEAVTKLAEAVKTNPTKTSYKLLLAKAHRYAAQPERAVAVLEEIVDGNPDHVEAGIELATLLTPKKEPQRVIGVLTPLLSYKHDYPLFHLLAVAHYEKEEFETALEYFEEAIKLNPRSSDDYYQLANIYLTQKRFAKAADAYEKAGQLGLSTGVYHFKLASVYFNLHNFLGVVTKTEVIGGKPGELKNNLLLLSAVPGEENSFYTAGPRSAIYQVTQAQQKGIDVFEVQFLEANTWLAARRYAKASALYAAIEEKVTKEDAGLFWYNWSQTALGMNQYDDYLARLNQAIETEPEIYQATLADAYVTVANRHQQRGDLARYLEYVSKAVTENPLSARLHLLLAEGNWLANKRDDAIEQYKLVLELEPDHPDRVRLQNRIQGLDETASLPLPNLQ